MINEVSVHPKPKNNYAKILSLASIVLAVICVIIYSIINLYRGVVGVVGVMFIVTAVLIYTKYVAVDFYYDVRFDSEGIPLFVVRQITGKRGTTLCRIELSDIESVVYQTAKERRERKSESGAHRYVYSPTLFPKETYLLVTRSRYEKCEIIIECSDEFAEMLRSASNEAKTMRAEQEEE